MALHDDLLEQALHLVQRERGRPRQASLRRAVSAAYYSLFHLLASDGAQRFSPTDPPGLRARIGRAFIHADMRAACLGFASGRLSDVTSRLAALPIEAALVSVAKHFVDLQAARHDADYDISASLSRADTLVLINRTDRAFRDWRSVRNRPNATVFLAALLHHRNWNK